MGEQTRVERLRLTQKQLAQLSSQPKSTSRSPATPRPQKKQSQSNSESVNFDPFNTPAPPTTPSSAPAFECKDEGFFPHSSSCKKYFWSRGSRPRNDCSYFYLSNWSVFQFHHGRLRFPKECRLRRKR